MRCEGTALHCAVAALAGEDVAEKFVTPLILLLFVGFVVYTQLESIIEHVSGSGKKVSGTVYNIVPVVAPRVDSLLSSM
jgi:hypothetical protein